jgi:hypothetical protein
VTVSRNFWHDVDVHHPMQRPPIMYPVHVRAGVFAAGGSLVGFGTALVLQHFLAVNRPLSVWLAASVASAALAVRLGYPERPRGLLVHATRAISVSLVGAPVCALIVFMTLVAMEWPFETLGRPVFLVSEGVLLAALARLSWPRNQPDNSVEPSLDAGVGGLLPNPDRAEPFRPGDTFALASCGPAIAAEESEGRGLVVEVLVRWAADVLRVHHVTPTRSVHLEDVLPGVALSANRSSLVILDGAGLTVVVPEGVAAKIHPAAGQHVPIDRATEHGLAGRVAGAATGTRIPLALGTRVVVFFGPRDPGQAAQAYRAEQRHIDFAPAPVVVEVELVRVGRAAGRGLGLGGHRRLIATTGVAAVFVLAALRHGASVRGEERGEDRVGTEQVTDLWRAMAAISMKVPDDDDYGEDEQCSTGRWNLVPAVPSAEDTQRAWRKWKKRRSPRPLDDGDPWELEAESTDWAVRSGMLFETTPAAESFGEPPDWRMLDAVPFPLGPPRSGNVQIGRSARIGLITSESVQRVLRQGQGRFRVCYDRSLSARADLRGRVTVRFAIGQDGAVSNVSTAESDLPDPAVLSCVTRSFVGLSFPRLESGVATVTVPLVFTPRN